MSGKKIAITLFKYFPYGGLQKTFWALLKSFTKETTHSRFLQDLGVEKYQLG